MAIIIVPIANLIGPILSPAVLLLISMLILLCA